MRTTCQEDTGRRFVREVVLPRLSSLGHVPANL